MDIRQAIFQRLHACSSSELKEIIESGIASKEETVLPGLGVLLKISVSVFSYHFYIVGGNLL